MSASSAYQVAVVTGASTGIGRELARVLAAQGCKVGLVARRQDLLKQLAADIEVAGGRAAFAAADVADRGQALAAIHALGDQLGPVDLLVANAGAGAPTRIDPTNVPELEAMFRVNFFGVVYSFEAVLPDMLRRGRGHLAAVSSLAAYRSLPGQAAYCASKAAVNSYLEGLRIQLRCRGVAVTTVCPGFVRTPMTADHAFHMPFMMDADEAARRIVRALRRRQKVYDFPWPTTRLVKLSRWVPDWIMARFMRRHTGLT